MLFFQRFKKMLVWNKNIEIHKYTKIQKYKNLKIQKYKITKLQKYKNTSSQCCQFAPRMLSCKRLKQVTLLFTSWSVCNNYQSPTIIESQKKNTKIQEIKNYEVSKVEKYKFKQSHVLFISHSVCNNYLGSTKLSAIFPGHVGFYAEIQYVVEFGRERCSKMYVQFRRISHENDKKGTT